MSRPRGGRHRDPAENRRRMFVAILLAFGLSTAATSLWAVGSPLDGTAASTQTDAPAGGTSPSAAAEAQPDEHPDLLINDSALQPQDAEEEPSQDEPSSPEPTDEPEPEPEPETADDPAPDRSTEAALVAAVNDERSSAGCGSLEPNGRLDTASRLHAEDMAANDYFDHTSLDGRSPTDRAAAQGYSGGVGENIAAGYRDVAAVMEGWMNSEGHRANILNCDYDVIGIGVADDGGTLYWVQNFG